MHKKELVGSIHMTLEDSFEVITPCIVGFYSRLVATHAGKKPIFANIFGTGFIVDGLGIAVTNRHVIENFDRVPRHPSTGDFPIGAAVFLIGDAGKSVQFLSLDVRAWWGVQSFTSSGDWYGSPNPDIGFVQLGVREVPFLANFSVWATP
jgi:hypothetical protein